MRARDLGIANKAEAGTVKRTRSTGDVAQCEVLGWIPSSAERGRKRKRAGDREREAETLASSVLPKDGRRGFQEDEVTDKMLSKGKEDISRISDSESLWAEVTLGGLTKE